MSDLERLLLAGFGGPCIVFAAMSALNWRRNHPRDGRSLWRRITRCSTGMCPCEPYEDGGGCGGQCVRCGRIVGYVTREQLRAYADRRVPPRKAS